MVKVVRVSSDARLYLTANELFGWPDWVKWSPSPTRKRKRKPIKFVSPEKVEPVEVGIEM